jgi:hypothetical protein
VASQLRKIEGRKSRLKQLTQDAAVVEAAPHSTDLLAGSSSQVEPESAGWKKESSEAVDSKRGGDKSRAPTTRPAHWRGRHLEVEQHRQTEYGGQRSELTTGAATK